jgi:alcohol dehydrogenase (NADP+)
VISRDRAAMKAHSRSFDFILNTVAAPHDLNAFLALLKRGGTMTLVGVPDKDPTLKVGSLIFNRTHLAGSLIGGIAETQEMLDYCAAHDITADVEIIPIQQINEAFDRMVRSDVKYRFVIDMASLRAG